MNQREAARRQKLITDTLAGLHEILTTNLRQELDRSQEQELKELLSLGDVWMATIEN